MKKNAFDQLHPLLKDVLLAKGITTPTAPQEQAIPAILNGKHTLLIAPTGLGKTESALLPILHQYLNYKHQGTPLEEVTKTSKAPANPGMQILYITPLRALNRDMLKRTIELGEHLGIDVAVRHGDTTQNERNRQSRNPPELLITTPETLQILFTGKRLRQHLTHVKWIVIDEVHELATEERGAQLSVALERLQTLTKKHYGIIPQRVGLSATVGLPREIANYLVGCEHGIPRSVNIIQIDKKRSYDITVELPKIQKEDHTVSTQLTIEPMSAALLRRCHDLIETHTSTLLFINTRDGSEILASRFHQIYDDFHITVHHGSLSKNARIESETAFKTGNLKGLIATSSLELGIDVGDTDYVIQYNSPREVTRLVQRIGRSGHQIGKTSAGKILATNIEDLAESMVIARQALQGELEQKHVRQNPLSVLCNQIISITLEYGRIPPKDVYTILTRAYPFHTLSYKRYQHIIDQLRAQRNIWIEEEPDQQTYLTRRRNSRSYFLDNISMIPDEKTYPVIDITTRKTIGTLDEGFVLTSGHEGSRFILRGYPWVIVQRTDDDTLLVNPIKDMGNVPSWVGEDIPVPYNVAQEVGMIRRHLSEGKKIDSYPTDDYSLEELRTFIINQQNQELAIPSDRLITIEIDGKSIIINACFGTKVNETIARLISSILIQSMGESIGINSDAYRITLELPGRMPPGRIQDILMNTKPETLEYIIETIMRNSSSIRYQLVHTARKMGGLRRDFDHKNVGGKRLFGLFEHTPIFDEALDRLIWNRMDISTTQHVLTQIQNSDIEIIIQRIGPLSTVGLETIRGLMAPQRADRTILMALKKRLEDVDILMACTNCHKTWMTNIRRLDNQPKCSNCGAIRIAVLRRYQKDQAKLLKKKDLGPEELKEFRRLQTNGSLVLQHGKYACMALMGRGIGPDTAARILRRYTTIELANDEQQELEFLRDILKAELHYARTRGFWSK